MLVRSAWADVAGGAFAAVEHCLLVGRAACGVRRRRLLSQRLAESSLEAVRSLAKLRIVSGLRQSPIPACKQRTSQGQICQITGAPRPRQAVMQTEEASKRRVLTGGRDPVAFLLFARVRASAASPRRSPRRTDERPHLGSPATPRHRCGRGWTAARGRPRYTTTFSRGQSVPVQAAVTRRRTTRGGPSGTTHARPGKPRAPPRAIAEMRFGARARAAVRQTPERDVSINAQERWPYLRPGARRPRVRRPSVRRRPAGLMAPNNDDVRATSTPSSRCSPQNDAADRCTPPCHTSARNLASSSTRNDNSFSRLWSATEVRPQASWELHFPISRKFNGNNRHRP